MTGSTAALVSLEKAAACCRSRREWKEPSRWNVPPKRWAPRGPTRNVEKRGQAAPTMCLGMDGTGVPMRAEEVAGRTGKPPDGSAKTREAKAVTVWTAESRDADALLCGILARSPMRLPWKAPLRPTSTPTAPTSPSGSLREATPARLHPSLAWRGAGRWLSLDLEHRPRTVPSSRSDARPVSRQTSCTPRRAIHFRRDQRKHAWGDGALGRTGRWQTICRSPRPAGPSHVPRRGHPMRAVPLPQSGSHALPEIPLPRTLYFHRRGRGGMPSRHRYPARARRYGWDRMPSSPFAVASSAGGTKTSGSAAGTGLPRDSLKSDVRPDGK